MAARISHADWKALHGIACFALLVGATFVPVFRIWPWLWIAPLAAYFLLVALLPPLRRTFSGWSFGRVTPRAVLAAFGIAIVSCAALFLFEWWRHPDLHAYAAALPGLHGTGLIFAEIVFAILNAFLEELLFRGIFFDAIESQTGTAMAVVITAALFGYGHMHGYPPGPIGAVLAGAYGLMLGWLRVFTGGLGLPVLTHITADATIFVIVIRAGVLSGG
jgi:membrane protease YdiL (CAAX protease family)